jgi:hypothetical protein
MFHQDHVIGEKKKEFMPSDMFPSGNVEFRRNEETIMEQTSTRLFGRNFSAVWDVVLELTSLKKDIFAVVPAAVQRVPSPPS